MNLIDVLKDIRIDKTGLRTNQKLQEIKTRRRPAIGTAGVKLIHLHPKILASLYIGHKCKMIVQIFKLYFRGFILANASLQCMKIGDILLLA